MKTKAFIDANVIFSASYNPTGTPATLLRKLSKNWSLVTSNYAIDEAGRNLRKKAKHKIAHFYPLLDMLQTFRSCDRVDEGSQVVSLLPPKDRPILRDALISDSDFLITGDGKDFGPIKTVINRPIIVSPTELSALISAGFQSKNLQGSSG